MKKTLQIHRILEILEKNEMKKILFLIIFSLFSLITPSFSDVKIDLIKKLYGEFNVDRAFSCTSSDNKTKHLFGLNKFSYEEAKILFSKDFWNLLDPNKILITIHTFDQSQKKFNPATTIVNYNKNEKRISWFYTSNEYVEHYSINGYSPDAKVGKIGLSLYNVFIDDEDFKERQFYLVNFHKDINSFKVENEINGNQKLLDFIKSFQETSYTKMINKIMTSMDNNDKNLTEVRLNFNCVFGELN